MRTGERGVWMRSQFRVDITIPSRWALTNRPIHSDNSDFWVVISAAFSSTLLSSSSSSLLRLLLDSIRHEWGPVWELAHKIIANKIRRCRCVRWSKTKTNETIDEVNVTWWDARRHIIFRKNVWKQKKKRWKNKINTLLNQTSQFDGIVWCCCWAVL